MEQLHAFFQSPTGYAIYATLAAALVAFISGVAAAVRDNTFSWQAIDAFVRADLMGRVVPIFIFLFGGFALGLNTSPDGSPNVAAAALTTAGLGAAAAYVTTTVAAVLAKWTQGQKQGTPDE